MQGRRLGRPAVPHHTWAPCLQWRESPRGGLACTHYHWTPQRRSSPPPRGRPRAPLSKVPTIHPFGTRACTTGLGCGGGGGGRRETRVARGAAAVGGVREVSPGRFLVPIYVSIYIYIYQASLVDRRAIQAVPSCQSNGSRWRSPSCPQATRTVQPGSAAHSLGL